MCAGLVGVGEWVDCSALELGRIFRDETVWEGSGGDDWVGGGCSVSSSSSSSWSSYSSGYLGRRYP